MKHSGMRPFMAREAIATPKQSWMVSERVKNGEEKEATLPVNWLQTFKRHAGGWIEEGTMMIIIMDWRKGE